MVKKLSTGADSTLENWIALSTMFFGEDSNSTKFLQDKAKGSKEGVKAEVVADEGQLIMLLTQMNAGEGSN